MKRLLQTLLLCMCVVLTAQAKGWDEQQYKQIEQSIRVPQFANREFPITKYGAKSTNTAAKNQKAIQKAIDKCSQKGGGRVIVPAGQHFLTAAIQLKSGVNFVVEEGAVLEFAFEPELYPIVPTRWEGLDCWNLSPLIYAYQAKDIAITGKGTIDGGGSNETWWPWCGNTRFGMKPGGIAQNQGARARLLKYAEDGVPMDERKFGPTDGLRPQMINLNQCEGILIEDVTLLRSPFWVIHPLLSKDITVRGVHINNDGPNGDGCDPESCDRVLIENCYFNTGDDCIAIKSGRNNDGRKDGQGKFAGTPSKNIIIRGCKMQNGHGGVVIGSEISGGCQNVYAEQCAMDSPSLDRVLRIKTNSCRGGIIENINMRNIVVGQCKEAVLKINTDYEPREVCCRGFYPIVRNVTMENVTCQKSKYGVMIVGYQDPKLAYTVNHIDVRNCQFNGVYGKPIHQVGLAQDITYENLTVNGSLVLQNPPYKHYSEWLTYSEMKRVPKSYMLDFSTKPKWSYVMGIELESMLDTYLRYGGEDIRKYCQEYTDTMINQKGEIRGYNILDYNLDNIRTGHFVTRMYQKWPEQKNLLAMQTMMKQLQEQPRTIADKVYWHKAIYAYQVWLDGIFMGLPFRTLTAPITEQANTGKQKGNRKAQSAKLKVQNIYDDAVNQLKITYNRTLDPKTGLNRHAYDETRKTFWADKETGLSQHCWGRAQGWYTMALIEVLDALPENYARRSEVIDLLVKDFDAILRWQDKESGVWYQVMDSPGKEGNYLESTCSAMFTYALLKAYRKGYVGEKYRDAGIRAYKGMINHFIRVNQDQTISLIECCSVAGLGPAATPEVQAAMKKINPKGSVKENLRRDGSYKYYLSEPVRDNDAKGVGPFIWASLEMEMLGYTTENITASIDREAVLFRNRPVITSADPLASLTVGNGHFATTVDVTGLQTYVDDYKQGVPLNAMSDWGWHAFPNKDNLTPTETEKSFDLGHGHPEIYAVEYKKAEDGRHKLATEYFRINPHRLNLGAVGLQLQDKSGHPIALKSLTDIHQTLNLWQGEITSNYQADGEKVNVTTIGLPDRDAAAWRIMTPLFAKKQAAVTLRLPYPTGKHADDASDWNQDERHTSRIVSQYANAAVIKHHLDTTTYYIYIRWEGQAKISEAKPHTFLLTTDADALAFEVEYRPVHHDATTTIPPFRFDAAQKTTQKFWHRFWTETAFADFGQCTDPRAPELERRVVLSQYLTRINCANSMPPQETGLTYNTWFGRPHLEMTWWHAVDFALWNQPKVVRQMLDWYNTTAYPVAKKIAQRQGFKGIRWMKMTDPWAGEAPSNTGSFLIWQQPHYIYLAEEMYRAEPTDKTLKLYGKQVEETAEFMADFVSYDAKSKKYYLKGATAMQESMSKDFSYNHPFELAYWYYGLSVAQQWRERQGLERNPQWDKIMRNLTPVPTTKEGIITAGLPKGKTTGLKSFDPFNTVGGGAAAVSTETFDEKCRNDHPACLGSFGLLPANPVCNDTVAANKTLDWVMKHWNFQTTWGWDYGMIAMAAARLGDSKTALDALLIDTQKNTYLKNGHNFQTADRLRLYLPGNGALLTAVAMMCAGWDGCQDVLNPGFPKDGQWNVRWEGLHRMQ
ncbi:MAG: glycoside hydrolase family 88 protein [Prevotella sp.]|nr:glycoside hydrolase family 88 protein [Prevotella sp.]